MHDRTSSLLSVTSPVLLCACITLLAGCPGEEPADTTPNTPSDMASQDMPQTQDMGDMSPSQDASPDTDLPDMPDMPDMCEPVTTCPQDTCGMLDDGCGGTVDCGVCECVDGVPQTPTCGSCGFGMASCEASSNGAAQCSLPELTAPPGDCDKVIYVRADNPPALPDGSRDKPFSDLTEALKVAREQDATFVAIAQGDYELSEALTLTEGMHLVGGFTDTFLFDEEGSATITITPTGPNQERVGVEAINLTEKTWLKQLTIQTTGVQGGLTLYSVHVVNSPGLHLEEVEVITGELGDGSSGKNGADGANGEQGGNAPIHVTLAKRIGDMTVNGYTNGAFGGLAGLNTSCRNEANGGAGGEGSHIIVMDAGGGQTNVTPVPAESGFRSAAGIAQGGQAGTMSTPNGAPGAPGTSGTTGADGVSGVASGSISRTYWEVDADGSPGIDGNAGTGGSGGGGSWWMEVANSQLDSKPGASGGGGGAGGCGGTRGSEGQAGATGFGMLIVGSIGVTLDRVKIQSSEGGKGGNGGLGGQGGAGAPGGQGSLSYAAFINSSGNPVGERDHPHQGGLGGNGASGGDGGSGGAGAGGSSFGIYCDGSSTVVKMGETTATAGMAGRGGTVGSAPAQDGLSNDVVGCW